MKPNLTKLRISSHNPYISHWQQHVERDAQITIAKGVSAHVSLWNKSLVSLKLGCIIDVPQFLLVAGDSSWPLLERVDMVGILDDNGIPSGFRQRDDKVQACDDLLRGLVAALPRMPLLTKVGTRFRNTDNRLWAFGLRLDLGGGDDIPRRVWQLRAHTEPEKRAVTPCCPVPDGNATAVAHGINLAR